MSLFINQIPLFCYSIAFTDKNEIILLWWWDALCETLHVALPFCSSTFTYALFTLLRKSVTLPCTVSHLCYPPNERNSSQSTLQCFRQCRISYHIYSHCWATLIFKMCWGMTQQSWLNLKEWEMRIRVQGRVSFYVIPQRRGRSPSNDPLPSSCTYFITSHSLLKYSEESSRLIFRE